MFYITALLRNSNLSIVEANFPLSSFDRIHVLDNSFGFKRVRGTDIGQSMCILAFDENKITVDAPLNLVLNLLVSELDAAKTGMQFIPDEGVDIEPDHDDKDDRQSEASYWAELYMEESEQEMKRDWNQMLTDEAKKQEDEFDMDDYAAHCEIDDLPF